MRPSPCDIHTSADGSMWVHMMFEHMMFIVGVADTLQRQRGADAVVAVVADEGASLLATVLLTEMSAQRGGGADDADLCFRACRHHLELQVNIS